MGPFRKNSFHMRGERGSSLDLARGRLMVVSTIFVIAFFIVAARMVDLAVILGDLQSYANLTYIEQALKDNYVRRADIVDRNGVLLARSLEMSSLYADPSLVQEPEALAKTLLKIFPDKKYGDLLKRLQGKGRYAKIQRNLTPEQQAQILYLGHPALGFEKSETRLYPQGNLLAHMVGAVSSDNQGLAGVENSFNALLSEKEEALTLTADVRIQHILNREIKAAIQKFKAKAGAGLVMDASSGEVLAAVSYPDFDPYAFGKAKDKQKFNRFSLGTYEMGSVFKIFSVAAFLDKENEPFAKTFDAREPMKVRGRKPIGDFHPQKRILTLPEVFIHSSNIGTALMAEQMGTEKLIGFYRDIGLLEKAALELPEVGQPFKGSPWQEVDTLSASFGHAIATTPLNVTAATASIINGGLKVEPTLILNKDMPKESLMKRVVSPQTAHRMRQLMRLNVSHPDGSGGTADVPGFMVGGKTGTADKRGSDTRIASFVGAFPMNAPRYVVTVMIDEPQGIKESFGYATGGWVAAPVVGNVISGMAVLLGMKPEEQTEPLEKSLTAFVKTKEQLKQEVSHDARSH